MGGETSADLGGQFDRVAIAQDRQVDDLAPFEHAEVHGLARRDVDVFHSVWFHHRIIEQVGEVRGTGLLGPYPSRTIHRSPTGAVGRRVSFCLRN